MYQANIIRDCARKTAVIALSFGFLAGAGAQSNYFQLHSFDPPTSAGTQPIGQLIEGNDGNLYGTTQGGGTSNKGAVFKLAKDGSSYGVVFSLTNAAFPAGGVVEGGDGALYGTTTGGGSNTVGAVFRVTKDGGTFGVLHDFLTNGVDGKSPAAGLLMGQDGLLYGTTLAGGTSNRGTIFKINSDGTGYTTLYSFTGSSNGDGDSPVAAVSQGVDGLLYGTTRAGGSNNLGTVFKLNTNGGAFAVLHHFRGGINGDGSQPLGNVVQGSDGLLYGTTSFGNTVSNRGTLFRLSTNGNYFVILHSFPTNDPGGNQPSAGLLESGKGVFYGTAQSSDLAHDNSGTIFKINANGSGFVVLHNFTSTPDGDQPQSTLLQGSDGALYGTAFLGGNAGLGTAFRVLPMAVIDSINPTSGAMQLNFSSAVAGQIYQIQATTNLLLPGSWQLMGTRTGAVNGTFQFLDSTAGSLPQRFYRAAIP